MNSIALYIENVPRNWTLGTLKTHTHTIHQYVRRWVYEFA
jgi:hypothetical protein